MKHSFSRKKATSFALLVSFIIMLFSGLILWIFPHLTNFSISKPILKNQHIVFGTLFALLSLYHMLGINREHLFSYLRRGKDEGFRKHPELLTTLLATALLAMVSTLHLQPFSGSVNTGAESDAAYDRYDHAWSDHHDDLTEYRPEHSRHHHVNDDEERGTSPQLADNRNFSREYDEARFKPDYTDRSRTLSSEAPEDELHRRTTASCVSCH